MHAISVGDMTGNPCGFFPLLLQQQREQRDQKGFENHRPCVRRGTSLAHVLQLDSGLLAARFTQGVAPVVTVPWELVDVAIPALESITSKVKIDCFLLRIER